MDPYYDEDGITIYHGDCRDIFPLLDPPDLILTDPPYGIAYQPGGFPNSHQYDMITGDTDTDALMWALHSLDGRRAVFGADHALSIPAGGTWHVWDKRVVEEADRIFGSPFEMIWCSWKQERLMMRVMHTGTVNADRHVGARVGDRRGHPTQKPVVLMRRLVDAWTNVGDVIVDPFMGSGTTLRAAKDLGRRAIGIEIEERYCEIAVKRLAQGVLPL